MRSSKHPASAAEKTAEIPLFPLSAVLYPGGPLPLRIFEPRYVDLVRRCMRDDVPFGVVLILSGAEAAGEVARTAAVGTSARIADFYTLPEGLLGLSCLGMRKFRLLRFSRRADGLNIGEVAWLPDEPSIGLPADYLHLSRLIVKVLAELGTLYDAVERRADDAAWVGYRLAEILPVSLSEKQEWLELDDPLERLALLSPLVRREED